MKRLLRAFCGGLMAIVVVFPATAQDKAATAESATVRMLPNVLSGQWETRIEGAPRGKTSRLFPIELTFSDQSNPKDIKGSLKMQMSVCRIENTPFTSASLDDDVFKATVPLPDACAERAHLYFIRGASLTIDLKIVNEGGTITAKGKAVNPAPGNQWSYRAIELTGRI